MGMFFLRLVLVENLTPDEFKFRIYGLTKKGNAV